MGKNPKLTVTMTGALKRVYDAIPSARARRAVRNEDVVIASKTSVATVSYFSRALRDLGLIEITRENQIHWMRRK